MSTRRQRERMETTNADNRNDMTQYEWENDVNCNALLLNESI